MLPIKRKALYVAIASSLLLTACGGGGSSGTTSDGASPSVSQSVSGSAVKGVMKFATVSAYELDDKGERLGLVGTAETDQDGKYTLDLEDSYLGGLLEIEIGVNERTLMTCDAAACGTKGEDVALPANFKLSAIASKPDASGTVSAPITAWSTMAAKRTKVLIESGKSLSEAARQATAEVSQVAGFDVGTTAALNIENLEGASASEAQAAVMNAVVADLIWGGDDTLSVAEKLEKFASDLNDGVVGNDGDSYTIPQLADATRNVVGSTPNLSSDTKDLLNNQTAQYDSSESGLEPTYDESLAVDDESSQADKIAAFQKFVSQARTWVQSIEDLDSDALSAAVQVDADTIGAALGDGSLNALQMSMDIVGQSLEIIVGDTQGVQNALDQGTAIGFEFWVDGVVVGTAEMTFADDNGLVINLVGTATGEAATTNLPFGFELRTGLPVSALELETGVITSLLSSTSMTLTGLVSDGSGFELARLNGVEARLNLLSGVVAADASGVSDEQIKTQFQSASLTGEVELFAPSGESFRGEAEGRVVRLSANQRVMLNDAPVSIERLRLSGSFASADGSTFTTSATLNVNNASSFDTFSWLDYSEDTRLVWESVDGSAVQSFATDLPGDAILPWVDVFVSATPDGSREGYTNSGGYVADGAEKYHYLDLDGVATSDVTAAAKTAITAALPAELTFAYWDEVSGNEQTFSVSVAEALQSGAVAVHGFFGEPDFRSAYLTINPVTSLLPAGVTDAMLIAGLPDLNSDYGSLTNYGVEELSLTFGSVNIVNELELALRNAANVVPGAVVTDFSADEMGQWGYVSFTRLAELQYYEACVADPVSQLQSLGYSWFDPMYEDSAWVCANATLTSYWSEGLISADTLVQADGIVRQALTARYGDVAQGIGFQGYYLGSWSGEGYLQAEVEFPDLESADNFIDASFTLSAAVDMPELPAATVTATATRNSYLGGKVLANVKWNGGQYSLQVSSDNLEQPGSVAARFFNPQGYELAVNVALDEFGVMTGLTGDAFINGEDIGDVVLRAGAPVITYPNGSETVFETLF